MTSTNSDQLTASVINERYAIIATAARGGMADVFHARDLRLDRDVAVKVLRNDSHDHDHERFRAEAALLSQLNHPNLVRLFDAGDHDGLPFVVLEWCDRTLADLLVTGPLPPPHVAQLGHDIALVLGHLHEAGIVHRDIKPTNVLLSRDGRAVLADLGAALVPSNDRLTATGLSIGTLRYVAPEQMQTSSVGPPADVYALGLTLTEAATGRPAFDGDIRAIAAAKAAGAIALPPSVAPALRPLLTTMTDPDPRRRPTAAAVANKLEPSTSSEPTTFQPTDATSRLARVDTGRGSRPTTADRNRRLRRIVASAMFACAALLLIALLLFHAFAAPAPVSLHMTPTTTPATTAPSAPESTLQARQATSSDPTTPATGTGAPSTTVAPSEATSIASTTTTEPTASTATTAVTATTTPSSTTSLQSTTTVSGPTTPTTPPATSG